MATKKVAKKAPAKKKAVAKKATKKVVKKVAKKAPAKKAPAKKSAKKVAKKSVKKAPAKRSGVSKIVVPPVPVTSSSSASKAAEIKTAPATPVASQTAKKQGSSNRVVLAVVVGILALGAIVLSKGSNSSNGGSTATPTESASPSESASPTASESTAVASIAAPLGIVAHYTAEGATIFWNATTAADGLKGYSVEFRANGGTWNEVATVGSDVTKYDITKSDTSGWTSFKISAVYSDGQKAEGKVFGLPGQYK